jgi:hypothetical protein
MSKFKQLLTGKQLMEKWNIEAIDLIDYILQSKLTAYDYESGNPYDILTIQCYKKEDERIEHNMSVDVYGDHDFEHAQHVFLSEKVEHYVFRYDDIVNYEKLIEKYKERKPILKQRDKAAYTDIAADMWKKNQDITIAGMARTLMEKQISIERKKPYGYDTIRNWIQPLAPKHKPGRPPKKKP